SNGRTAGPNELNLTQGPAFRWADHGMGGFLLSRLSSISAGGHHLAAARQPGGGGDSRARDQERGGGQEARERRL
ncbi:MAG: hypothetical protein K0U84_03780, partial [Actinomycetia bacterium]|nr:hypothetical protein [Actinomycetes bacterium]